MEKRLKEVVSRNLAKFSDWKLVTGETVKAS